MRYCEALKNAEEFLSAHEIEDARTDAWLLLEYTTGLTRASYLAAMRDIMQEKVLEEYQKALEKRAEHIPLQHITGTQDFMGFTFHINEDVLIPRQDTEILAELVLAQLQPGMEVLDLCTGSGCIAVSIAKLAPQVKVTASDISGKALEIARKNAENLQANVCFVQGDLYEPVTGTYDLIVSNPPYICTKEITTLSEEVRCHEPYIALDGLEDGLHFYRRIIEQSKKYLKPNGQIWFEIGYDQGESVPQLLKAQGFSNIRVTKDLAGLDRVVNAVMIDVERERR